MKKKSAIEQLFYGKRGTFDSIPKSGRCEELSKNVAILEMTLVSELKKNEKIYNAFSNFSAELAKLHQKELEECYKEAFGFGLQIGIEVAEQGKFSEDNFQQE